MRAPYASDDILEQNADEPLGELPVWFRRTVQAVAAAVGFAVIAQTGLLSAEPRPEDPEPLPTVSRSSQRDDAVPPPVTGVIAGDGLDVVRYDRGRVTRLAELPPGFAPDDRLWAVDDAGYPPVLYALTNGKLFRIDARRGGTVADAGRAERIIGLGPEPGQLVVQVRENDRLPVLVLEAETGAVVDRDPFPGFKAAGDWTPRGAMTTFGIPGLVLTRPGAAGREEVAVAWSERGVSSRFVPGRLQRFGAPGKLLGVADDWVLFLDPECPSPSCLLTVLSFSRKGGSARAVAPPEGWSFEPGVTAGQSHEALVPVVNDQGEHALARLVPGGDGALLLRDSVGLDPSAGMIAEPDGPVFFLRATEGSRVLARWSPVESPNVITFPELPPIPASARLVCVCD